MNSLAVAEFRAAFVSGLRAFCALSLIGILVLYVAKIKVAEPRDLARVTCDPVTTLHYKFHRLPFATRPFPWDVLRRFDAWTGLVAYRCVIEVAHGARR